jgi:hypothetical protein
MSAIPTADIKISDIDVQLGSPYGATDFSLYNCYNFASTASGITIGSAGIAGNFHNLAMGVSSPDRFAQQIWGFWNGGSDLPVGNWGGYYNDANVVLDWDISNDPAFKPLDMLTVDLYLSDAHPTGFLSYVATINLSPGQSSVEYDFDTGIPAYSTYNTTGYWIYAAISSTSSNAFAKITARSDTDGVGPDLSRQNNPSFNGAGVNVGVGGSSFSGNIIAGQGWAAQIAWNKRTSFTLTVTP